MNRVWCICGVVLIGLLGGKSPAAGVRGAASAALPLLAAPNNQQASGAGQQQQAVLQQYCVTCHNDRAKQGGLSLENQNLSAAATQPEIWEKVIRKLRAGVMPPPGVRRPTLAEYEGLRDWLESEIDRKAPRNPGAVVLHRLNRTEYANVIRDLLDLEIDVSTLLPPDDSARGFDNIAGSLTISSTLLEAYVSAATRVARTAVGYWKTPTEAKYIAPGDNSQNQQLDGLSMGTRGGMAVRHNFPADGEYTFEIQNYGIGSYIPGEKLELSVDGERVQLFEYRGVGLSQGMSGEGDGKIEITVPVKAGTRTVGATFLAPASLRPSLDSVRHYERTSLENNSIAQLQYPPVIGFLRIQGPFQPSRPEDSRSLRKIFTCRPAEPMEEENCAKQILTTLARRAYRRPVTGSDVDPLLSFYQEARRGGEFEDGIELALRRLLASPQFLIRAEREPANLENGQSHRISDLELASRLSFFLWSSIPDDELITVASQNRLRDASVLAQQVRRMLADPKSDALVENFAAQYLYLRNLPATSPSSVFYPDWDHELRVAFQRETEMLFESIIRENRSVVDLLNADYTFVNERLAKHYGIPNIYGAHFRRVSLGPELDYRRGILGKGSFLSVTWVQNFRTSPVKRGVWVLENLLGTPPPEPPPNVPPLEDTKGPSGKTPTLRERMTLHRTNQPCAGCHAIMDNIGFALENFDADGKWRTRERLLEGAGASGSGSVVAEVPLDVAVDMYDGQKINGPSELRRALLRYSPQFVRTFTERMMTFALGRGVEYYDMPVVRAIVRDAEKQDNKFNAIVMGIVNSAPFQMRTKGE
jgi:mono/diheme cytochrome c family protein